MCRHEVHLAVCAVSEELVPPALSAIDLLCALILWSKQANVKGDRRLCYETTMPFCFRPVALCGKPESQVPPAILSITTACEASLKSCPLHIRFEKHVMSGQSTCLIKLAPQHAAALIRRLSRASMAPFMSSSASCTDEQAYHSNGFRMTQLAPQGAAAGDPSRKFSF